MSQIIARKSDDYFCLKTGSDAREPTKGLGLAAINRRIAKKHIKPDFHRVKTIAGSAVRPFVTVELYGEEGIEYLANCVTGSLYDLEGRCLSGPLEITEWYVKGA